MKQRKKDDLEAFLIKKMKEIKEDDKEEFERVKPLITEDELKEFRKNTKSVTEWKKEREPKMEAEFDESDDGKELMEKVK